MKFAGAFLLIMVVIVLPGFLGTDVYLVELWAWLYRMDYKPYFSGIGLNAECPNLLIRRTLNGTIDKARRETGRKVHLIGHSLGGIIAMSAAAQRPEATGRLTYRVVTGNDSGKPFGTGLTEVASPRL